MLIKILTRQHAYMMDQMKMNFEDAYARRESDEDIGDLGAVREEEIYRLEERLEDF